MKRTFAFTVFLLLLLTACGGAAATPATTETGAMEVTVFRAPT